MEPLMQDPGQSQQDHGAWDYDPASGKTRWSRGLYELHGVDPDDFKLTKKKARAFIHPDDVEMYEAIVRDAIETRTPFACQYRIVRPDGELRMLIVRGSFVEGVKDEPGRLVGTTQDVTDRADEEQSLAHLASHDSVSGLFNRSRFMEELTREIATGRRSGMGGALLVMNMDQFSEVNNVLGHMAGDELLLKVATVLKRRLRDTDTLARIGGDEFGMILPGCGPEAALRVATQLIESVALNASVRAAGSKRRAHGSIGMSFFGPPEQHDPDELLVEAELAVMRAKANGRGHAQAFSEEMRAEQAVSMSMEDELRTAIGGHELCVQFQPIISLADGATIGCEALVRWEHPIKGMVGPGDFVSVAEETGLISRIGRLVLETACSQGAQWHRQGRDDMFVSVNISPRQLTRPDLANDVSQALTASGFPPDCLCLEISEAALLRDTRPIVESLGQLKALGVRLAIDDFGAGASSFGILRILPIDQIKIDHSFIQGLGDTASDRAVVAAVVSLAKELGVTVIAEGVETQRQQAELRDLGTELAQGFLYSPARDPEDLQLDSFGATVAHDAA